MTIASSPHSTPIAAQLTVPSGLIVVVTVSTIIPGRTARGRRARTPPAWKDAPALDAHEPDLGRAEQHRIDLVEVPVRLPRGPCRTARRSRRDAEDGQALDERLELVVGRVDGELDLAAVEDRVVRAPDRLRVGARHRRQRAGPEAAHHAPDVEVELVQLVQRGLDDARGDLDAAGEARRRREQQREVGRRHAGALGHVRRELLRRLVARSRGRGPRCSRARRRRGRRRAPRRGSARGPARWPSRSSRRGRSSSPRTGSARQASAGWSVTTVSPGSQRPSRTSGAKLTEPRPPMVISANRRPASSPPGTALPQSITRVPPGSVRTATRSASASAARRSASSCARWLSERVIEAAPGSGSHRA